MGEMQDAIFRLEGSFDQTAAVRLRQEVMHQQSHRAIVDFSHVEKIDDSTLASLTVNLVRLQRTGYQVALLGLREHQVRILNHFGVDVSSDGSVQLRLGDERRARAEDQQ
jgi:anti-anti-sigma regulatory factor